MTTRKIDMEKEEIVQHWLDENYYTPALSTLHWERCMDTERQFRGADIVIELKSGVSAFIDEKTKLHPLNAEIPCLCHETSQVNRAGYIQEGWLTDPRSMTTHWQVATVYTKREVQLSDLQYDDIDCIDLLRYSKKSLMSWLSADFDLDAGKIRAADAKFRDQFSNGLGFSEKRRIGRDAWYKISPTLWECPINLVVPRQRLLALPNAKHITVSESVITYV